MSTSFTYKQFLTKLRALRKQYSQEKWEYAVVKTKEDIQKARPDLIPMFEEALAKVEKEQ